MLTRMQTRYPANFLRNKGADLAPTKYLFMADIDLVPSNGAHKLLKQYVKAYITPEAADAAPHLHKYADSHLFA